jgi:hypothetical protein
MVQSIFFSFVHELQGNSFSYGQRSAHDQESQPENPEGAKFDYVERDTVIQISIRAGTCHATA